MSFKIVWRFCARFFLPTILYPFSFLYLSSLGVLRAESPSYLYFPTSKQESQKKLLNIHNRWFDASGELKLGLAAASRDETFAFNNGKEGIFHDNQEAPRFFFEEILLKSHFSLANFMKGVFHVTLSPEGASVKEGYAIFPLPAHSFIQMGLDRRFFSNPMHYEAVIPPLITTTFGRNPDLSLMLGSHYKFSNEKNLLYWKFSLSNGQRFAEGEKTAHVGKQKTYPIFNDIAELEEFNKRKEVGLGLGFKRNFGSKQWIDISAFSFFSKLNKDDPLLGSETLFLKHVIPGYESLKRNRHRLGLDVQIQWDALALWTQYIHALDGEVKRHGIALEPSYTFRSFFSEKFPFQKMELMYRWNHLDTQTKRLSDDIPESPFTWDRTTHTFGMKMYSKYFFIWRNEYHLNLEEMGRVFKGIKNNEFLSQVTFFF